MPAPNTFAMPRQHNSECATVRRNYHTAYGRNWPYDDNYIRELARELPAKASNADLLSLMREND